MTPTIRTFTGDAITPHLGDLARLRIEVFRAFPYLYDGDLAYEARYVAQYARAPSALFVLAFDGDRVVGASTAMAMADAGPEYSAPLVRAPFTVDETLYYGESVLDRAYRGRGVGRRFFAEREAHALRLGLSVGAFCAVERPDDHPRRPADHAPLDGMWRALGYTHHPDVRMTYTWKDLDEDAASPKTLSFWLKRLAG